MLQQNDIDKLLASIDKQLSCVQGLFDRLKNADRHYVSHAPMEEDIESKNDEWEVHYFEGFGFSIETQCEKVSNFSFFLQFNEQYHRYEHENPYRGKLPFGLNLIMSKKDVHKVFGAPLKAAENLEQYHISNELILGLIYDDDNQCLRVVTVGSKKVFSDENLFPNRYSEMCMSLHNIQESDSEEDNPS